MIESDQGVAHGQEPTKSGKWQAVNIHLREVTNAFPSSLRLRHISSFRLM
jgi:hypothetical protein